MDDTITLNDGTDDHVFSSKSRKSSNTVQWFGASANNDLAGRPILAVSNDITKAGIARATASITVPLWDTASGQYKTFVRANVVVTMPSTLGLAQGEQLLTQVADLLTQAGTDIVSATA